MLVVAPGITTRNKKQTKQNQSNVLDPLQYPHELVLVLKARSKLERRTAGPLELVAAKVTHVVMLRQLQSTSFDTYDA